MVNHFTKHAWGYPMKTKDKVTMAGCLLIYFATFGNVEKLATDPGSEFTNELLQEVLEWLDVEHKLGLVAAPTSCGVEGTNKLIMRHIKAILMDKRM